VEPPLETENSLVHPDVDDEDDDEEDYGDRNFLHFPGTTFSWLNVATPSCQFLWLLDFSQHVASRMPSRCFDNAR